MTPSSRIICSRDFYPPEQVWRVQHLPDILPVCPEAQLFSLRVSLGCCPPQFPAGYQLPSEPSLCTPAVHGGAMQQPSLRTIYCELKEENLLDGKARHNFVHFSFLSHISADIFRNHQIGSFFRFPLFFCFWEDECCTMKYSRSV